MLSYKVGLLYKLGAWLCSTGVLRCGFQDLVGLLYKLGAWLCNTGVLRCGFQDLAQPSEFGG
jgi:hypothetical protein